MRSVLFLIVLCAICLLPATVEAGGRRGIGPLRAFGGAIGTNRALIRSNRANALQARQRGVQRVRSAPLRQPACFNGNCFQSQNFRAFPVNNGFSQQFIIGR